MDNKRQKSAAILHSQNVARLLMAMAMTFFIITPSAFSTVLKELPEDWTSYTEDQIDLYLQQQNKLKAANKKENLGLAKASLINGNIRRAKFFLNRVNVADNPSDEVALIKKNYQAIIAFIEDRPRDLISLLESPDFQAPSLYPQICLLKLIGLATKPMDQNYRIEMTKCQQSTGDYSKNEQLWLDNLLNLKSQNQAEIRGAILSNNNFVMSSDEISRIWLKTGLFFNKEEMILKHMDTLSDSIYRSSRAREIIGLLYYRDGDYEMAKNFIEDIDSPNADNIRGNLSLDEKKYELAFGHYKLALQKKANSLNALERSLPLAWLLKQWEDGIELLDGLIKPDTDPRAQQALRTAMVYKTGDMDAAKEELNYLEQMFDFKGPLEVQQIKNIISLHSNDHDASIDSSTRACQRHDGLNCWIFLQEMSWGNFGELIKKKTEIHTSSSFKIDSLRTPSQVDPIEEIPIVDQKDIEEIDGDEVKLVPGEFF